MHGSMGVHWVDEMRVVVCMEEAGELHEHHWSMQAGEGGRRRYMGHYGPYKNTVCGCCPAARPKAV